MEIHKLGDFVSDAKGEASLKITDIRQAVKNENRVNIFVNGEYSFSLDVAQVVDLGVKKGLVVSEERLAEFKKASEFGKLYQRALEWVLVRPRSTRETRDYLCRKVREKKLDSNYIDEIIDKLTSKKYLEDEKFTQYYVENRFVKKGISSKRLKMELMKKGISHEVIERVMSETGRNDEDEIRKMIMKKRGRYDDEKLIQYLCRRGFQFEMVRNLVHEMDLQNLE